MSLYNLDSPQAFALMVRGKLLSFLDRVSVWTSLKGSEGKTKALALATTLEGPEFEMSTTDRRGDEEKTTYSTI